MYEINWKKSEDREFCLTVIDENRLFVTGLVDPENKAFGIPVRWDQK